MKKILIVLAVITGLVFALNGTAAAQDQTLTADPASVDAAGEAEITFTGSGFTVAEVFMTPCPGAEGDIANLVDPTTQCDLDAASLISPVAGEDWTETVTYDIPDVGLLVAVTDLAQTEQAAVTITVGSEGGDDGGESDDGGSDEAADSGSDEAADSGSDEAADSGSDEAADGEEEELANTGAESDLLLVLGAAVIGGGALLAFSTRKFRQI